MCMRRAHFDTPFLTSQPPAGTSFDDRVSGANGMGPYQTSLLYQACGNLAWDQLAESFANPMIKSVVQTIVFSYPGE